jgi:excinuclease ABC subunit C
LKENDSLKFNVTGEQHQLVVNKVAENRAEILIQSDPIIFARNSHALHLLQRVRDEAHRVAIGHHRKRRNASSLKSELEDIPGVGPATIKSLLITFGSVKNIRAASVSELSTADGVGAKNAEMIWKTLHPEGA